MDDFNGGSVMGTSLYAKYRHDHDFGDKKVLNLGCGFAKLTHSTVVNLDAYAICKPNVVHNLTELPLPFEDVAFDYIIASHVFEHLPNWWAVFEDCVRILKHGGSMDIWLPGTASDGQLGYRDHLSYINGCSFYGVANIREAVNAWCAMNRDSKAKEMQMVSYDKVLINQWWVKHAPKRIQRWMAEHLRNVIGEEVIRFIRL